jgi:hypothetical protein
MLDANVNYITFTWDDIQDFTTTKPILQIENFYWLGNSRAFSLEKRECDTCWECWEQEKIIQMFEVWPAPGVKPCQFYKRCKTIKANIPKGVTSWYIKYYAGFNRISDENEIMPVDDDLFPALQMLLAYYTSPITWDSTQQDKASYINDYNIYIKKYLDQYSKRPGRSFNFIWA